MSRTRFAPVLLLSALVAAGCSRHAGQEPDQAAQPPAPQPETAASAAPPVAAATAFDVRSLPVSDAALGEFPYLGLPQGYALNGKPLTSGFDQLPFWTGDRLEPVEGKVWAGDVTAQKGSEFSALELQRNIEALVTGLGGRKIVDGRIPQPALAQIKQWPGNIAVRYVDGLGDIYNNATQNFVIHRADRDIWIHLCAYSLGAGLLVVETKPVQITATLLPASALKAQIDTTGKVALHVNFATDKADILPDSQPQIAQVVALLAQDPALALAVNGYTDNSGDAAHNKVLSEGRAKAVVAALVAQGIAAQRLTAAGYGDADPVADNASEQGKAQNRRVELVKQG